MLVHRTKEKKTLFLAIICHNCFVHQHGSLITWLKTIYCSHHEHVGDKKVTNLHIQQKNCIFAHFTRVNSTFCTFPKSRAFCILTKHQRRETTPEALFQKETLERKCTEKSLTFRWPRWRPTFLQQMHVFPLKLSGCKKQKKTNKQNK